MENNTESAQICTPEFVAWLATTSFSGIVEAGEQWDTETAWPSPETMKAARKCLRLFAEGNLKEAEQAMWDAQSPFV